MIARFYSNYRIITINTMNDSEKGAEFRQQMGEWLEEETGKPTELKEEATPPEEEWVDIDVSEFDEGMVDDAESKPEKEEAVEEAEDVVGVQRMLEDQIHNTDLQAEILRVGMERYNDGDSLSPRQQGMMELARRLFKDGANTPERINEWLAKQNGEKQEVEPTPDDAVIEQLAGYRDLEPGSAEETAANLDIVTDMLRQADVPNPEDHAIELRAALRKQAEMTSSDREFLSNMRGVVEQKARNLRTGESETETEVALPKIDSVATGAYEATKMMSDGPEKQQAIDELLSKVLPADADRRQYNGLLSTFMKGDTPPSQALQAIQKQFSKRSK